MNNNASTGSAALGWREFADAIANGYESLDNEGTLRCSGCGINIDRHEPHVQNCIVLRARAALDGEIFFAPNLKLVPAKLTMTIEDLPPLPHAWRKVYERPHGLQELFYHTGDQMRTYAMLAIEFASAPISEARGHVK